MDRQEKETHKVSQSYANTNAYAKDRHTGTPGECASIGSDEIQPPTLLVLISI